MAVEAGYKTANRGPKAISRGMKHGDMEDGYGGGKGQNTLSAQNYIDTRNCI
jgi:hypothetical protein